LGGRSKTFCSRGLPALEKLAFVEATAESLLQDSRSVIKIDCAESQQSHEIASAFGIEHGLD
jgi:hypothetical protein